MQVLSVYPRPTIEDRVADLFIGVLGQKDREVWLVSPWITDFEIPLAQRGFLLPYLGSQLPSIRLSKLLELVARENAVSIVLRPPHVLIGRGDLGRLSELLATRAALSTSLKDEPLVRQARVLLEQQCDAIAANATAHAETVDFAMRVASLPGASVHFNERLHAKLLVTPAAALVGSSNFTTSGMRYNDELTMLVSDAPDIASLYEAARATSARPFSLTSNTYRFRDQLPPEERAGLDTLLAGALQPGALLTLLRQCAGFNT